MRRWRPEVLASAPEKQSTHRAMEDVLASIAELRHYRAALFGAADGGTVVTTEALGLARGDGPAHGCRARSSRWAPRTSAASELRVWKHAPPTLRTVLDLSPRPRRQGLLGLRGRAAELRRALRVGRDVAARLLEAGVERGDRVAIAMRNLPEWVVAFWSGIAAGGVAVPLNAWWTGDELAYGVADSGARGRGLRPRAAAPGSHRTSQSSHPPKLVVVVDEHRGATHLEVLDRNEGRLHLRDASSVSSSSRRPRSSASSTSSAATPRPVPPHRRSTSTPTTTRRSSTPRARRVARRARSARTATPAPTS